MSHVESLYSTSWHLMVLCFTSEIELVYIKNTLLHILIHKSALLEHFSVR